MVSGEEAVDTVVPVIEHHTRPNILNSDFLTADISHPVGPIVLERIHLA